jgi:hypothetical protein
MPSRFGIEYEDDLHACPKCTEPQLVEVLLGVPGKDGMGNAIAHCHFCGHMQFGRFTLKERS